MATKEKTSWADETDEFEEQQAVPTTWNRNTNQTQERSDVQENVDNKGSDNEEQPEETNDDKGRKSRKPVPFPDEPPYTAFVGNLAYDIYREEIAEFFDRKNCKVESVRLLMNRETNKAKGFGYVVFQDLDSLKRAVELNGETLLDRPLRIDVAESRNEREDYKPRRDQGRGNRNPRFQNNNRNYDRKHDKENTDKENQEELKERPKIDLKPRTVSQSTSEETSESYQSAKVNPFGQAKPRDESVIMKKKELERQQRNEDEVAVPEEKSPEVKEKSNKFNGRREDKPQRREDRDKSSNKPKYDRSKSNKRDNKNKEKKDDKPRPIRPKEPEKTEQKSAHVSSKNIFDALEQEDD